VHDHDLFALKLVAFLGGPQSRYNVPTRLFHVDHLRTLLSGDAPFYA
jgi:hypothetical protein